MERRGEVEPNYSIVAPHVILGHGTLYHGSTTLAESRRLARLVDALRRDLASFDVPPGNLRLVAPARSRAGRVVLLAGQADDLADVPADVLADDLAGVRDGEHQTHAGQPWWLDPHTATVMRCDGGWRGTLAGLVVVGPLLDAYLLRGVVPSTTVDDQRTWLGVLRSLGPERVRAASGGAVATTIRNLLTSG